MTNSAELKNEMELLIGMAVDATDGPWGLLEDIVIDPVRMKTTHLVVEPRHRHHKARLIPVDAIVTCGDRVALSLSSEEIVAAPKVEVTDFVSYEGDRSTGFGQSRARGWPYYPGMGAYTTVGYGYGYGVGAHYGSGDSAVVTTTYDRTPPGTVEIRRDDEVVTSDHHVVGRVDGFVTSTDGAITHLVLARGHLWSHREITIPLDAIAHAGPDHVRLDITRDAVAECASVRFQRHG